MSARDRFSRNNAARTPVNGAQQRARSVAGVGAAVSAGDFGFFVPVDHAVEGGVDEDVLLMLKDYAKKRGSKYQSVLNALLRMFFEKPAASTKVRGLSEERVRRIVQEELRKLAS